jgi:hypothetical protein
MEIPGEHHAASLHYGRPDRIAPAMVWRTVDIVDVT